MFRHSTVFTALVLMFTALVCGAEEKAASLTFHVSHSLLVKDIPAGSKQVRIWFWLPDDGEGQKLLDLAVAEAPAGFRITRDAQYGHVYLYAEASAPPPSVPLRTEFTLVRQEITSPLVSEKAGSLNDIHRLEFADALRRDCPNMVVTPRIEKLANEVCANETNVARQVRRIYDYVIEHSDHYSLPGAPKSSGLGSAEYCLDHAGGGCTDQHALLIALARARGIPTRLHFGSRLPAKNEGKEVDPGYRCWVQYFVPNYGWVSADASAGDTTPAERDRFVSGLDARRIHFAEGRDLLLNPPQAGPRVNLLIGAYVEVDGKPHAAFRSPDDVSGNRRSPMKALLFLVVLAGTAHAELTFSRDAAQPQTGISLPCCKTA